jgi:hypothetical protein
MPGVVRSVQNSCRFAAFRFLCGLLSVTVCFTAAGQSAQENSSESTAGNGQEAPSSQPPATTDAAAAATTAESPSEAPAAQAPAAAPRVVDACLQEILNQQQLTRTIREMRNPLPRPTKEEGEKLRRPYQQLVSKGYGAAESKTVQDYLTYRVMQLTDPNFVVSPFNVHNLLREIEGDLDGSGREIGNEANKRTARRKFCLDVLAVIKPLFENNLDSRLGAITICRLMYEENPPSSEGRKSTLLREALSELIGLLDNPQQPDSVKAAAAFALRSVLRNCVVNETDQYRMVDSIAGQLARPCTETAYQLTLMDVLQEITYPRRTVGDPAPTSLKVFAAVLDDKSRPLEVRCLAALGVGRGPYDPQVRSFDPLAWKIADLTLEVGVRYTQAANDDPMWKLCAGALFFSFRPVGNTPEEARKGLLNRAPTSASIAAVAPLVIKVAAPMLVNETISRDDLKTLADWRNANQPADLTWDSQAPPLTGLQQ